MNLFNLFAKITLDDSEYKEKMKEDEKVASSFSSKIGVAFKTAGRVVAGFITGIVAVSTALAALTVKFVNAGSEIDDNAQKLGISTEAYQYWSLVLQRAGSDASQLSMVIRNLTTFTNNLSTGQGDALLTLQKLGIEYEDFMAMNTEEQFYAIIEALQGMTDQTEKVQIAQDIFGERVYQELLPLLNMEQGSLEDLRSEFESLGLIMSDDTVKSIAAVGDKLDNLGNLIKTAGLIIAADFLPEINQILDAFIALVNGSGDVETAMQAISDGIVSIIEKIAIAAPDIINAAGNLLINVLDGLVKIIPQITPKIVEVLETLLFKVVEILPTLTQASMDVSVALIDGLLNVDWGTLIVKLLNSLIEIVFVQLPSMLTDALTTIIDAVFDLFFTAEGLKSLGNFGLGIAEALINGLISGIESGVNGVINAVNSVLGGISKAWTWAGIPEIPDIPNVTIPRVSFLKDGGMFDELMRGTVYAVAGEDGAEIVAKGRQGTGVANVDQIAEAQYIGINKSGIIDVIYNVGESIVNGVMQAMRINGSSGYNIVVKIGERELKDITVEAVNTGLKTQGYKALKTVAAYGGNK